MILHGKFKFKGKDGSCGFRTGEVCTLIIQQVLLSSDPLLVTPWESQVTIPYSTLITFLENWEMIDSEDNGPQHTL